MRPETTMMPMITAIIEDSSRGNFHVSITLDKGYNVIANNMLNSKGTKTLCKQYIIRIIKTRLINRAATVKTEVGESGLCSIFMYSFVYYGREI